MSIIKIHETKCWRCGTTENITNHHAIPQRMKPLKNVIVPICQSCHNEINMQDDAGLLGYAYSVNKQATQMKKVIGQFIYKMEQKFAEEKVSKVLNKQQ